MLFGRIPADDKSDTNHMMPSAKKFVWLAQIFGYAPQRH
jgi:hypothetical protein